MVVYGNKRSLIKTRSRQRAPFSIVNPKELVNDFLSCGWITWRKQTTRKI